ncbi:glutamine synthetase family protein [Mycobacterium sp. DL592]|uniref:glutamine synthetase family protein n=1 Tax=Mycobacterium sp. DL592 TaxID=2675524 RepID=UPI0014210FA6|nr:glutamine synthetase family protein [Mycobacterium sp. DL592]
MTTAGEQYLTEAIANGDIDEVEVAWTDQLGHAAGKRVPAGELHEHIRNGGIAFSSGQLTWNVAAEVQENLHFASWDTGFRDIYAVPDLSTARPLPWRERVAHVVADIHDHDGTPLGWHPRTILRTAINRLADVGIDAFAGVELEFYLLDDDGHPYQTRLESYSLENANRYGALLEDLTTSLRAFTRLEAVETEFGPGQIEANLRYTDALTAADDAARLKYAVKEVAQRHGRTATFMAKPLVGQSGSSSHVHFSLKRDGRPLFAPVDGKESPEARHVIARLLRHLPAISLFGGHTVNAYKRIEPGSWAPSTVTWSGDNRSAAVRSLVLGPESSRLEVRTASAEANPYWLIAALLSAATAGLEAAEEPPAPASGNAYLVGDPLPADLPAAIAAARDDVELAKLLGPVNVEDFARLAESEWRAYSSYITDFEIQRYLHTS